MTPAIAENPIMHWKVISDSQNPLLESAMEHENFSQEGKY